MLTKKIKIIIGVIILIILISTIFIVILSTQKDSEEEQLIKRTGFPLERGYRVIETKEAELGFKIITNNIDGYEITIPSHWISDELASPGAGQQINMTPEIAPPPGVAHTIEGAFMNIMVFNSAEEVKRFFPSSAILEEIDIGTMTAYVWERQAYEDGVDSKGNLIEIPIEGTLDVSYLFQINSKKHYVVTCSAVGDEFNKWISLCNRQVQTFTILE